MAARMTREEVALALGEPVPQLAKSMQLKQFADPRNEAKVGQGPDYGDDDDADDDDADDDDDEEEEGNNDLGDGWEPARAYAYGAATAAARAAAAGRICGRICGRSRRRARARGE